MKKQYTHQNETHTQTINTKRGHNITQKPKEKTKPEPEPESKKLRRRTSKIAT
jgi:hypothetical protein